MHKIIGRRAVRSQAGLIAGTAIHSAVERLNLGKPIPEQEAAIDETLAKTPVPLDDYRTAPFLKDALAAFRAELGGLFVGWQIEEVEAHGTIELGVVQPREQEPVQVIWEFRRDMVGVDPDGRRWLVDVKTSSRNEEAQVKAMQMSGALMGYIHSWQVQHPDKPISGAQPVRVIMRKPTKNGVAFEFPKDGPIFFPPERIAEWRRHTLRKARELLERNPDDPEDWPLAAAELGLCRHTFGCCDYLSTCVLKLEDRAMHLASDAYESSEHERPVLGQIAPPLRNLKDTTERAGAGSSSV